jgi:hypothetical protein
MKQLLYKEGYFLIKRGRETMKKSMLFLGMLASVGIQHNNILLAGEKQYIDQRLIEAELKRIEQELLEETKNEKVPGTFDLPSPKLTIANNSKYPITFYLTHSLCRAQGAAAEVFKKGADQAFNNAVDTWVSKQLEEEGHDKKTYSLSKEKQVELKKEGLLRTYNAFVKNGGEPCAKVTILPKSRATITIDLASVKAANKAKTLSFSLFATDMDDNVILSAPKGKKIKLPDAASIPSAEKIKDVRASTNPRRPSIALYDEVGTLHYTLANGDKRSRDY